MAPSEQELIFDFTELHLVGVKCGDCGISVIFDLAKPDGFVPKMCPGCKTEYGIHEYLESYLRIYQRLKESKHSIDLRVRIPFKLAS
jgi:hypothetical protein